MRLSKRYLAVIGLVLLLAVLFSINVPKTLSILSTARVEWLVAAFGVTLVSVCGKALKWRGIVNQERDVVSFPESVSVFFKAFFLSILTPARIGEFARALYVRDRIGLVKGFASVLVDRLIDIVLLLGFALLGVLVIAQTVGRQVVSPFLIGVIAVVFVLLVRLGLSRYGKAVFDALARRVVSEKDQPAVLSHAAELWTHLRTVLSSPSTMLFAVTLGIVNWLVGFVAPYLIARSLGLHPDFVFFAGVIALVSLLDVLPISVAGIGTRDAALVLLLAQVGIDAETAVSFSFLYFLIGYVAIAIIGGILFTRQPLPTALKRQQQ
jgi:uncharacterized protein (TIRG00374 family)